MMPPRDPRPGTGGTEPSQPPTSASGFEPSEAVFQELVCYYLSDELPPTAAGLVRHLESEAPESAARIRHAVGREGVHAVIDLLQALRNNPAHPLVARIENSSLVAWGKPEMRHHFQSLLDQIITHLQAPPPNRP